MPICCRNSSQECDGCMNCQQKPEIVGRCESCGEDIRSDEDYYNLHDFDILLHDDCLYSWAEQYKVLI